MSNHLTPQDYTFMIMSYLNGFRALLGPVSVTKITKYCIKKSKELDSGDDVKIRKIVETTLEQLAQQGHILRGDGEIYYAAKDIKKDIIIFDNPEIKPNYEEINKYLSNIEERTRYYKPAPQDNEDILSE